MAKPLADELDAQQRCEEKAQIAQCVKAAGYVTLTQAWRFAT